MFPTRDPYSAERPHVLIAMARLGRGVTPASASAWFDVWVRQRFRETPPGDRPIASRFESRATRIPVTTTTASMFSAIIAVVGLVLLIACANVANMMLARGIGRQREIAVRMLAEGEMALLVRSASDLAAVRAAVSSAAAAVREDAAFPSYPMRQVVALQIWALQAMSNVVSLLAAVALLLALSGTYAVVAFLVMQRTREFGIRLALGATAGVLVRGVVAQALRLGVTGMTVGALMALALSQLLASVIEIMPAFGVAPYLTGGLVVMAATACAALVPSLRVRRVDPSEALRSE